MLRMSATTTVASGSGSAPPADMTSREAIEARGGISLAEDGGIIKYPLDTTAAPSPSSSPSTSTAAAGKATDAPPYPKGANAQLHYKLWCYTDDPDLGEMGHEPDAHTHSPGDGHDHNHTQKHAASIPCPHHAPAATAGAATDPGPRRPHRVLVADSRQRDNGAPFDLRVGRQFAVPALETCVQSLRPGERARFLVMPPHAAGLVRLEGLLRDEERARRDRAAGRPGVLAAAALPPGAGCSHHQHETAARYQSLGVLEQCPVEFDIVLLTIQHPGGFVREPWELTTAEKWAAAAPAKEDGTRRFRASDLAGATAAYRRALMLLEPLTTCSEMMDLKQMAQARQAERAAEARAARQRQVATPSVLASATSSASLAATPWTAQALLDQLAAEEAAALRIDSEAAAATALPAAEEPRGPSGFTPSDVQSLMQTTRLNYAACLLQTGDYAGVVVQTSEVLRGARVPEPRAYLRRARARRLIGRDLTEAAADLDAAQQLLVKTNVPMSSPMWQDLRMERAALKQQLDRQHRKEKRIFQGMFSAASQEPTTGAPHEQVARTSAARATTAK
ncbi:hypothetical protein CXG81DRAFT_20327 [Caulochytrium protostelioides]|uniref:Uncharacterized protein n=1 Tax=Caulochytrium protostelioides TaxID=1555241 RepID=A0A4P9X3K9_9FUNG|nr:hypothetical protein CXG81DRAFT_20327 [Caulochytrium protostelioides]|eukprot:RKO99616.1 hypothetical protein CXG81DRAFT_20327 [Caulochytrium protostelioides]